MGIQNGTTTVGNSIEIYLKIKDRIVIWIKRIKSRVLNGWTRLATPADESGPPPTEQEPAAACPCSQEHYSQQPNMEATQVFINRYTNKCTVEHA